MLAERHIRMGRQVHEKAEKGLNKLKDWQNGICILPRASTIDSKDVEGVRCMRGSTMYEREYDA